MMKPLPRYSLRLLPVFAAAMVLGPFMLAPLLGNFNLALLLSLALPPVLFVGMIGCAWMADARRSAARALSARAIVLSKPEPEEQAALGPEARVFLGLEVYLPETPPYTAVAALRRSDPIWRQAQLGAVVAVRVDPRDPQRVTVQRLMAEG
jgi:hypothetical protein